MQSLTPLYPVKFQHNGGWKTGMLMKECASDGLVFQRLVRLEATGEIVIDDSGEILDNPCREVERKAEVIAQARAEVEAQEAFNRRTKKSRI